MDAIPLLHKSPLFAQAAPAAEQATTGQILSGLLVLPVMIASIVMIVIWISRIRALGHALPAANRGILRVPFALTLAAIGLSLLMLTLMSLVAMEDQLLPPAATGPAAPVVETGNAETGNAETGNNAEGDVSPDAAPESSPEAETITADEQSSEEALDPTTGSTTETADNTTPSTVDGTGNKTAPGKAAMTPANMVRALWQTVVMDIILFLVFGFVVFVFSSNGRVRLSDRWNQLTAASAAALQHSSSFVGSTLWPDLDQPSELPSLPGSSNSPTPEAEAGTMLPTEATVSEEPFSFLTELRFAGEVFLAAYVPTTALRILIVLVTMGLLGEEPGQHPFLEMMKSGVGTEILILILLTAVILAPVVEELQYRVVVLGGIAQLGRPMLALGVSSILFAFAHGFPDSLALVPLAFALGYAYLRRRSYITVIMVHFLFNAFNMLLALLAML